MALPPSNTCLVEEQGSPFTEEIDSTSTLQQSYVTDEALKEEDPKPDIEDATCDLETQTSSPEGVVSITPNVLNPFAETKQVVDPIFGDEHGSGVHYRTMEWWHAGILIMAETISLGVLALPQCLATVGLVPGLFLILGIGLIAIYTGLIIGQFKLAYPHVQSFADAGELMAGRIGHEVFAVSQVLILVFIQAAHVLSFAIAMNVLTDHGTCTVTFAVIGAIVCFVLGLPRTLKAVSFLSMFSCVSIIIAVTVAMIAIAIAKPNPGHAIAVGENVSIINGLGPVLSIVLAYSGHVGFFPFAAELREPRDFAKSVAFSQGISCTFYLIISTVIYFYAGPGVKSPALSSASPLVRKIGYGLALPSIIIAGVVNGSVACKYVYFRIWKGTNVIHETNFRSVGSWVAICVAAWFTSWVISMAVPNFNILLGLISALFCSWFSFGIPSILWLYMNRSRWFKTTRKTVLTVVNISITILGVAICILGLWSSGTRLAGGAAGAPFSCADNQDS